MTRVAVGGTFEPLHDGHKALLKKAYELGKNGEVIIGLTSNELARQRAREVLDYTERFNNLKKYIIQKFGVQPKIIKLHNRYGTTLTEDFDYIVVSPETYPVAQQINKIRIKNNLKPINIVKIDYVLAKNGKPISSTRIKNKEIDIHGKLI
ncbi:MAG: phosphopantetheine adenylyltransferase [Methanosarcinales archaeon]